MSTYEQLPVDPLVFVTCAQTLGAPYTTVVDVNNTTRLPFACTDVLNQYHKRGYKVVAHSLLHNGPDLWNDGYAASTWTMVQHRLSENNSGEALK